MDLRKHMGLTVLILSGIATFASAQETVVVQEAPAATAEVMPQQPAQVVIIQESAPAPADQTVITQPTTVVEDTPLVESKAEKLRRDRQQAEVETEQKIVEKLEEARLQDEQKRMKKLFGNKLEAEKEEPVAAPVVAAPVVTPAPEEPKEEINKDELKAEIAESVKADLTALKEEEKLEEFKRRLVFGASLGTIDYEVGGIESDFSGGVSVGYEFRERMELEGSFHMSQHTAFEFTQFNSISIQDMDQYNFTVGLRYSVLPFFISPVVGALASYTHRVYSVPATNETEVKSDALDAGFLVGVDVLLSNNMSIAFDYRRFINIESRVNDNTLLNLADNYNSFEQSDYDMVNLALRIKF